MTADARARSHGEAGFSLVEGLIAALILLFVIVGVLPLVSQSMLNNLQGNTASFQTSSSVDGTETLLSVPFNAPELVIAVGSTTSVIQDLYVLEDVLPAITGLEAKPKRWLALADFNASTDLTEYTRTATIEQFGASDLDSDDSFDTPLDGITDPGSVHFKRVTMQIRHERSFLNLPGARTGSYEIVAFTTY